jgi:hypothetical protein
MPYIDKRSKKYYEPELRPLLEKIKTSPHIGELVYLLTRLVLTYLGSSPCFEDYDKVIGALECTKLELYRRRVAEYEEVKKRENGDCY